jgi:hypothetical protein
MRTVPARPGAPSTVVADDERSRGRLFALVGLAGADGDLLHVLRAGATGQQQHGAAGEKLVH